MSSLGDPSAWTYAWLGTAALLAGFVDAVVGGGGLIQLPSLVLAFPTAAPVHLLAANKLAGTCGTTASSATYFSRVRPDPRTFAPLMGVALLGSAAGAVVSSHLSRAVFDPLVIVALVAVGGYVVLRPELGAQTRLRLAPGGHLAATAGCGLVMGFYDGALGPGTGAFFVVALVGVLGYSFLEASARARLANWATNVAALLVFVVQGVVPWKVGLLMGAGNLVGSYVGARTALARGSRFVRVLFLLVVVAFVVRLGVGVLGSR